MRRGLALGLVALAAVPAQSPTTPTAKVAWLAKNGVPIRSSDPTGEDFSDLRPLAQAIGGAQVVMLGADSPRSGEIGNRMVRFLHQEMGFDLLVSDASFFDTEDVELAWDRRKAPDRDALPFARSVIHHKKPALPVYVLGTHLTRPPLHLIGTGVGWQRSLAAPSPRKRLVDQLFAIIDRVAPHAAAAGDRKTIASHWRWFTSPGSGHLGSARRPSGPPGNEFSIA